MVTFIKLSLSVHCDSNIKSPAIKTATTTQDGSCYSEAECYSTTGQWAMQAATQLYLFVILTLIVSKYSVSDCFFNIFLI